MTTKRDNGKGDMQRPLAVPMEKFDKRWDDIFKKPTQTNNIPHIVDSGASVEKEKK